MANVSLISRVLSSLFFRRANLKAVRYARNSKSLMSLIRDVVTKSGGLSGNVKLVRDEIALLTRMVKAYATNEYRDISWKTLIRIVAVLIYFVSPLDFLPDFLPIVGISDDIALILWLASSIRKDTERFRQWEKSRGAVAEVVTPLKTKGIGQS